MSKKTLIIDDTKNIRLMMTKCLELEGWEVISASNGKEGLELISKEEPDLVFLDIKLPEVSGTEVLRRMRGAGIQTPVIVITAYPTIKNAVDCTRLGVVSYLQKPFTADRLRSVLSDLNLHSENGDIDEFTRSAEIAIAEGDLARAMHLLGSALCKDPADGKIYEALSRAYGKMGKPKTAEKFNKMAEILKN